MEIMNKVVASCLALVLVLSCTTVYATNDNSTNNVPDVPFDQKIGINGLFDSKIENMTAGGIFREFHNFGWTYDMNSGNCYFKSSQCDFDLFYENLHNSGVTVLPCIIQGNNEDNKFNKPVKNDDDTRNPESYKVHSSVMFNYAARYGSSVVSENRLSITTGTDAKTGLGYIKYYENWNEPDKDILGDKAHFSAEEFSAMCSADYDGHEGALGKNYGIKQADSTSKLVFGGLSSNVNAIEYLNDMKKWCDENRPSKTLPFDVISFHFYAGSKSPETSDFISKANELIKWRNENAPDKEIWLTEFGWDTNISSLHGATSSDSQRDWIIRQYLISDRIGINRSFVYCLRDTGNSNSEVPGTTSGLTTYKGKEEKKSSWYGVKALKTTLNGYKFSGVISEDSNLYIYKYTNPTTAEDCYALWCPTDTGSTLDNYELNIGENSGATLIQLQAEMSSGITSKLAVENNIVKVNVSESPIFVKVSPTEKSIILNNKNLKETSQINLENTNIANKNYSSPASTPSNSFNSSDIMEARKMLNLSTFKSTLSSSFPLFIWF